MTNPESNKFPIDEEGMEALQVLSAQLGISSVQETITVGLSLGVRALQMALKAEASQNKTVVVEFSTYAEETIDEFSAKQEMIECEQFYFDALLNFVKHSDDEEE